MAAMNGEDDVKVLVEEMDRLLSSFSHSSASPKTSEYFQDFYPETPDWSKKCSSGHGDWGETDSPCPSPEMQTTEHVISHEFDQDGATSVRQVLREAELTFGAYTSVLDLNARMPNSRNAGTITAELLARHDGGHAASPMPANTRSETLGRNILETILQHVFVLTGTVRVIL